MIGEERGEERAGSRMAVDVWRPLGVEWEWERRACGAVGPALTLFLAGAECPFSCVFCDLWRFTTEAPTPLGALPAQIRLGLEQAGRTPLEGGPAPPLDGATVKLYNASNFFEPRAVPAADDGAIAALVTPFERVVVECHPRLVGERCLAFAERLDGRLEVAMGLETVHPRALPRLGKAMDLDLFDSAAERLAEAGIGLRAFVLVGAPFVPPEEAVEWAVRSARYAVRRGAGQVALIPVRGDTAELARLAAAGEFTPPRLAQLEEALERCQAEQLAAAAGTTPRAAITADLWDLERFSRCADCLPARRQRLARLNLGGPPEPRVVCRHCGAA